MPNNIFNIPLYFTGITTYLYKTCAKLTTTASVGQSVEHWSKDPYSASRIQSPAGSLEVTYFASGPNYL